MTNDNQQSDTLIRALPLWSGVVEISALEGGITNRNYLVADGDKKFVVRLGADIPVHQIKRFNEIAAGKAAFEAGLAPAIRYHEEGVLVMDYVPSDALTEDQVRNPDTLSKVITLVRQCHREVPKHLRGASLVFWVFHVIRDYAATLSHSAGGGTSASGTAGPGTAGSSRSAHLDKLPDLLQQAEMLENAAGPFDIVFGHNDLLPANILNDGNRLWLIDWEYAGFNTPLFDLGGLASNNGLDESAERWMLEQYFSVPPDNNLWRRYSAMKCASLLRETMWSMVSEIHSDIDFDYSVYTRENLERYEQSLAQFNSL